MTRDEIYNEIKNDQSINNLFALAMRRRDLWVKIQKNGWDADFMISVLGMNVNARNTFKSMMRFWTSKQILRFYYKFHYPNWRGFWKETRIKSGNFCPRNNKYIPDGARYFPALTKKQLLDKLDLDPLTIKKVYLELRKNPLVGLRYPAMSVYTHWDRYKEANPNLMNIPRKDLYKQLIDLGVKKEDLSSATAQILQEKLIILYDYSHIVFDRPVLKENYPFRSFQDAKQFTKQMGFNSSLEYLKYRFMPEDMPVNPREAYPQEWNGWGDYLGNGFVPYSNRKWRSFENARQYVRSFESIFTLADWYSHCKINPIPTDMPITIHEVYKEQYTNWAHFIGRNKKNKQWRSFEDIKQFIINNNIRSKRDWFRF